MGASAGSRRRPRVAAVGPARRPGPDRRQVRLRRGQCGACTVLVDGQAGPLLHHPGGRRCGQGDHDDRGAGAATATLHPLQEAFLDAGALQCGYCTPGMIMAGVGLLDEEPAIPATSEIVAGHGREHLPLRHLPAHRRRDPARPPQAMDREATDERPTDLSRERRARSPSGTSCEPSAGTPFGARPARVLASSLGGGLVVPLLCARRPPAQESGGSGGAAAAAGARGRSAPGCTSARTARSRLHRQGGGRPEHPHLAGAGRRRGAARCRSSRDPAGHGATRPLTPFDAGTFGSRTTPAMAPQLRRAAAAARELLLDLAAEQLEGRPRDADRRPTARSTHPPTRPVARASAS